MISVVLIVVIRSLLILIRLVWSITIVAVLILPVRWRLLVWHRYPIVVAIASIVTLWSLLTLGGWSVVRVISVLSVVFLLRLVRWWKCFRGLLYELRICQRFLL